MREYKAALLGLGGGIVGAIVVVLAFLVASGRPAPSTTPRALSTGVATFVVVLTATPTAMNSVTDVPEPTVTPATVFIATPSPTITPIPTSTPPPTIAPTPTSETPWTKAIVAVDGYTVSYPSDWVINAASSKARLTTITSWVPEGPGGMDGVPRGGVLIQISIANDSVPAGGEKVAVGDERYAGVMTTGDLSDPDPVWDPKLIRRVYYRAEGTNWLIQGIFGDEITDANPNFPIFMRIVQNITHVNGAAPTPTPIPTPTPVPTADGAHISSLTFDWILSYLNSSNYTCIDDGTGITVKGSDVTQTLQCTSSRFNGFFLVRIVGPNPSAVRNVLILTFASNPTEPTTATASRIFQSTLFCFLPRAVLGYAGDWITEGIGGRAQATFADVPLTLSDNPDAKGVSWLFMVGWP